MKLLFINHLFSEKIIQAITWTLIHSVWQGMILAALAALLITLTRKSGPGLRYNLLTALFVLFTLTVCCTFYRQLNTNNGNGALLVASTYAQHTDLLQHHGLYNHYNQSIAERFVVFCSAHASIIITVWFTILCLRMARMMSDLGQIQRIRHYKVSDPSVYWKERIKKMADDLAITRSVRLLTSEIIKVPSVTGFFKPLILIPTGIITQLPENEIEAILLHELAHIRRNDFLVNLLQNFVESALFFNPAVLWISSLIREERENCCDDLAIDCIKNKKNYVNALVNFQQYTLDQLEWQPAMAFANGKDSLLRRARRILSKENKRLNFLEKTAVLIGLTFLSFLPFVTSQRAAGQDHIQHHISQTQPANATAGTDTTAPTKNAGNKEELSTYVKFPDLSEKPTEKELYLTTVTTKDNEGNWYKLVCIGDRRPVFYINDRQITNDNEFEKYLPLIDKLKSELWKRGK